MLKKAGIIVTAATAGLLAVAPFALADTVDNSVEREQSNQCAFEQSRRSSSVGPVTVPALASGGQIQALNCVNLGDVTVVDLDGDGTDVVVPTTSPTTSPTTEPCGIYRECD